MNLKTWKEVCHDNNMNTYTHIALKLFVIKDTLYMYSNIDVKSANNYIQILNL